ncbi:replication initiation factor [Dechloromonas sp. ZY10]|uniref:replication initiation factor n=1 Tax=Dechloromonas aquae TaxID=2664436 RepID=UPI003528DA19
MKKQDHVAPTSLGLAGGVAARAARRQPNEGGHAAMDAAPSIDGGPKGAPPSNTAPYNSNSGHGVFFKALRWGVDSLYLSYPGELFQDADNRLKALKALAQSPDPSEVAKAQLALGKHVFEVKEKGSSLFPYIIEDGAFRIQLSRAGRKAPMAYVKVSAKFLAHVGPVEAEKQLYELLSQLGEVKEAANVSRIDLFVDFQSSADMESWDRHAWVTRATSINAYAVSGKFSGWSIGLGGVLSARLYNKLLEIVVSGKDWILPLWQQASWDGQGVVWRLEFEFKREVLTQKGLSKLYEVMNALNGLWSYATTEWLRLTLPNPADQTRCRWPIHPLWCLLAAVDWDGNGGPLAKRFTPTRSPHNKRLFQMACSTIMAFMAKHGYNAKQLYEAHQDLLAQLIEHLDAEAYKLGLPFDDYIAEKLALKRRQYNTGVNDPDQERRAQESEVAAEARAYRKESNG